MKSIAEFIESFPKKSTKIVYKSALKAYFESIKTSDEIYFSDSRNYENDVEKFFLTILETISMTFFESIFIGVFECHCITLFLLHKTSATEGLTKS